MLKYSQSRLLIFLIEISKIFVLFRISVKTLAKLKKNTSTEYTEMFNGLREIGLMAFSVLALFLIISLTSFSLDDAGWSHNGTGAAIQNSGGRVGAWIADFFLSIFGLMAYLIPVMIICHGVWLYKGWYADAKQASIGFWALKWVGFLATVLSGATLAYSHFFRSRIPLPDSTGGILGRETGEVLLNSFGSTGGSLLMLATFFAGITLFTGFSWMNGMEIVGEWVLRCIRYLRQHLMDFWAVMKPDEIDSKVKVKTKIKKVQPVATTSKPAMKDSSDEAMEDALFMERKAPVVHTRKEEAESIVDKIKMGKVTSGDLPDLSLLDSQVNSVEGYSHEELQGMSRQVELVLRDFKVEVEVVEVHPGPVITRFEIKPAPGVKVSRITGLAKDMARALAVPSVRVVEVIPGKSHIGLEIPNEAREMVRLAEIIGSKQYLKSSSPLTLVLGKNISGVPLVTDLGKMPHLLVAGTTGSGKSVAINAMILSLLYKSTPDQVRLIMIDPKMLELSVYEGIPHLLTPVVTDMKEAAGALRWCVGEMERRYRLMSLLGVRNLNGFNRKVEEAAKKGEPILDPMFDPETALEGETAPELEPLPSIVIVIDELADMMMIVGKKVEELIARLAQKARAAGLHLVLATQRPSVDVLTGLIKANVPSRLAFQVSSKIDSRTILDQGGAEALLGHGDMLFLPAGTSIPERAHGAFVDDHEVHKVVAFLKQAGRPNYLNEILEGGDDESDFGSADGVGSPGSETDALYDEAVRIVTESRKGSISYVQRRLKIGYNRAARMIEDMEMAGIVGPAESGGTREVIAPPPVEA